MRSSAITRFTWAAAWVVAVAAVGLGPLSAQSGQAPPAAPRAGGGEGGFGQRAFGLPDDGKALLQPEENYLQWTMPPGDKRYDTVSGKALEQMEREIIDIARRYRDAGHQFWGRIGGTQSDRDSQDWAFAKFKELGLEQVRRQETDLPPQWYPVSWSAELLTAGGAVPLGSVFPIQNSVSTSGSLELAPVWVGLGTPADFLGRDVKGKAVVILSEPTPGGLNHSPVWTGAIKRASDSGAGMVVVVMGFPGNAKSIVLRQTPGSPTLEPPAAAVPAITLGLNDGIKVREAIEAGAAPKVRVRLETKIESGLKTANVWGVIPGTTDEQILIMAHHDAFFDGALDNASGTAMMMEIARYYAAIPKAQRRRTLTFLDTPSHHMPGIVGTTWVREHMKDFLAKTALIVNCEHPSQTQVYSLGAGMMTSNTIGARRWYVGGSQALKDLALRTFREYGVALYTQPEARPGGELSQLFMAAPSFHILDHIFYHTDLDTIDMTPIRGIEAVTRAYLKIIDGANALDAAQLKAAAPATARP